MTEIVAQDATVLLDEIRALKQQAVAIANKLTALSTERTDLMREFDRLDDMIREKCNALVDSTGPWPSLMGVTRE